MSTNSTTTLERSRRGNLRFFASDVTGTHTLSPSDVDESSPAGTVAAALASQMQLPENVPWALRDDSSSVYLDDAVPIGEQLEPGAQVTITPKAHLG